MEIVWYGHSCFRITERSMASIVCDPYDAEVAGFNPLKLKADVVTVSNPNPAHNYVSAVKGNSFVFTNPGEYEVGGVFITGIQTTPLSKTRHGHPRNILYAIGYNGITVVHLGLSENTPTQTEIEELGTVNIILLPVGGDGALNASRAAEIVSLLEPNVVIPMMYDIKGSKVKLEPLNKFLKEMGLTNTATLPSYKVTKPSDLPADTQIIVLDRAE